MNLSFETVDISILSQSNVIIGQSHFIKTAEDIFELLMTSSPAVKFGLAFNEASGPCLIRTEGNDDELIQAAVKAARDIGAGHIFVLYLRNLYPISILNQLKNIQEVVSIYAATANSLQVIVAQSNIGRGIMGVIDGSSPKGVEGAQDKKDRSELLRNIIGYKK